jgi:hypothetical protein
MTGIFAASKCEMPHVDPITDTPLVTDCRVPGAPGTITTLVGPNPIDPLVGSLGLVRRTINAQLIVCVTTAPGNPYTWQRVIPAPGGNWTLVGEWGSGDPLNPNFMPAYPSDGSSAIAPGSIVRMIRGYLNQDWRISRTVV